MTVDKLTAMELREILAEVVEERDRACQCNVQFEAALAEQQSDFDSFAGHHKATEQEVVTLKAKVGQLEAQIAEAREACPRVRMQDHFDDSLLSLVHGEVSLSIRREVQAMRLGERVAQLEAELARWKICENCHEPLQYPGLCASGQDEAEQGWTAMLEEWCVERDALKAKAASLEADLVEERSDFEAFAVHHAATERTVSTLETKVAQLEAELGALDEAVMEAIKDRDYCEACERAAFAAGFYAQPKGDSFLKHELTGAPREFEFTAGGSAADIMPEAFAAYQQRKQEG